MLKEGLHCNDCDNMRVHVSRKGYLSHLKNNDYEKESVFSGLKNLSRTYGEMVRSKYDRAHNI